MGIDACFTARRKNNISRAEIVDILDEDMDMITWHQGTAFSWFTGIRYYEWENSEPERQTRLVLANTPAKLLDLIVDREILVSPDVAEYEEAHSWEVIKADSMTICVSLAGLSHDDPEIKEANQNEQAIMMRNVQAMLAADQYFTANPKDREAFLELAIKGERDAMAKFLQSRPELAKNYDVLQESGFIDMWVKAAELNKDTQG